MRWTGEMAPRRVVYSGVHFRSALEADWALNLGALGMRWHYEPRLFELPDGTKYRPDFYLPATDTWLEVKGWHNQRVNKPALLRELLGEGAQVIVGRPSDGYALCWEGDYYLNVCALCRTPYWFPHLHEWGCRACSRGKAGDEYLTDPIESGLDRDHYWGDATVLPFRRLPRVPA